MGAVGAGLGLGLGAASIAWDLPALGGAASLVALAAGIAAWRDARHLGDARDTIDRLQTRLTDLGSVVADLDRGADERVRPSPEPDPVDALTTLTDGSSGLYNEGYFSVALEARLSVARRNLNPVAVVLLDVAGGTVGGRSRPADPARVAASINATIREADTACRLTDGCYALVLEDTSENGAIWAAERIRRHLSRRVRGLTVWAGVACYPAHGLTAGDVRERATTAIGSAREWGQGRIEVAAASD